MVGLVRTDVPRSALLALDHGRQRGKGDGSEGESSSVIEYRPPSTEADDLFFDIGTVFDRVRAYFHTLLL